MTDNAAGDLLAVYREGATHTTNDGKVTLQKSVNAGATWGAKSYPYSPAAGHDYRDVSIVRTATDRLILNFFDEDAGGLPLGILTGISDDGGATWAALPAILTPYSASANRGATSGAILKHSSGALIMPVYGRNTGDTGDRWGVLRSTNNGASYGALVNVSAQNGDYNEATLIELPDGTIHAYVRQETSPGPIYRWTSTDAGVTWAGPTALGFNTNPGRPTAIIFGLGTTPPIILLYRKPGTSAAVYRVSLDLGATWGAEQTYSATVSVYAGGFTLRGGALVAIAQALEIGASQANIAFTLAALA